MLYVIRYPVKNRYERMRIGKSDVVRRALISSPALVSKMMRTRALERNHETLYIHLRFHSSQS